MGAINLNNNHCSHCNFLPFCLAAGDACAGNSLVTTTRQLARHEILCSPNHKFHSLYAIEQGAVKAYQLDANGREHIHAFYFAGEVLGFRAIHTGQYISTVAALTDSVVCELSYEHFLDILKTKPELNKSILELMSEQLAVGAYADAATAEQRIAAFIIDLTSRINGAIPMREVLLPMSRQDIGNYLGLTAETISRVFSRLQEDGVIVINRKLIQIINPQLLAQLAA